MSHAEKTESDITFLMAAVQDIAFFRSIPLPACEAACRCMTSRCAAEGQAIITQGDPSDNFFIILQGSVAVCCRDLDSTTSRVVTTLHSGATFGELSFAADKPRAATCIALERVELLALSKKDYNDSLLHFQVKQTKEMATFLQSLSCFLSWPDGDIENLSSVMQSCTLKHNTVIVKEEGACRSLYFVRLGTCRILKKFRFENHGQLEIKIVEIAHLGPGDVFGDASKPGSRREDVSVVADGPAVVLEIDPQDVQRRFSHAMKESLTKAHHHLNQTQYTNKEVLHAYRETERWQAYKDALINDIVQSRKSKQVRRL